MVAYCAKVRADGYYSLNHSGVGCALCLCAVRFLAM
jgi:hypothetical protein